MASYSAILEKRSVSSSRRRRIEWPDANSAVLGILEQSLGRDDMSVSPMAKGVIESELSKCDSRDGFIPDISVMDELYVNNTNWKDLLCNLYWRARRQSAVWDVFCMLVQRGYLNSFCLVAPFYPKEQSQALRMIEHLLLNFSKVSQGELDAFNKVPSQTCPWGADIRWLATMILRSGVEIRELFETIEESGYLGIIKPEDIESFKKIFNNATFTQCPLKPEDISHKRPLLPTENTYGFWLPSGVRANDLDMAKDVRSSLQRFNTIEAAFKETFYVSDEKLLLERDQVSFFETFPKKLPGSQKDMPEDSMTRTTLD